MANAVGRGAGDRRDGDVRALHSAEVIKRDAAAKHIGRLGQARLCTLSGGDNHSRRAAAWHHALKKAQGVINVAGVKHIVVRDRLAIEHSVLVALRVGSLIRGHMRQLILRGAVTIHVAPVNLGVAGVRAGSGAIREIELTRGSGKSLSATWQGRIPLLSDHDEDVVGEAVHDGHGCQRDARCAACAHH